METMAHLKIHHATLGMVGVDEHSNVYGITCKHVTNAAEDHVIYAQHKTKDLVECGRTIKSNTKHLNKMDVGIMRLNSNQFYTLPSTCSAKECGLRVIRQYDGPLRSLYNCNVSMYTMTADGQQTQIVGTIATSERHRKLREIGIPLNEQFIVEPLSSTDEMLSFAQEGDSGNIVCTENHDGSIEAVGIVTGGKPDIRDDQSYSHVTFCLFIPSALREIITTTGIELRHFYLSGHKILFETVDSLCPYRFDILCEQIRLTELTFPIVDIREENERITSYEKELSRIVNSRTQISSAIFKEDQPLQVCILQSIKACSCMYKNQLDGAERNLSKALVCIPKLIGHGTAYIKYLSKLFTYTAWYFRIKLMLKDDKKTLDTGLDFMKKNKAHILPSSIGYMYYESSKFYNIRNQVLEAERSARKAVKRFKQMYINNPSADSYNRLAIPIGQLVTVLLDCGEEFDRTEHTITEDAIDESEQLLKYVVTLQAESEGPLVVQKCDYLRAKCDLCFRKKNYKKALTYANLLQSLASRKHVDMVKDRTEAESRIRVLSRLVQT